MKRFVYLGLALGSTALLVVGFASLASCYRVPTPTCGFRCGPAGECPTDYTCSSLENRCHKNGTDPSILCDIGDDMPIDAPDAPIDMPIDVPILDGSNDAPLDAPNDALLDAPVD
jgi:hypothetical protein